MLIPGFESLIDASSQTGLDGEVVIDSPNQQVTGTAALEAPSFDALELVRDPCEIEVLQDRSSFTIEGKGGLPRIPSDFEGASTGSVMPAGGAMIAGLPGISTLLHALSCSGVVK